MSQKMDLDQWFDTFKPVENPNGEGGFSVDDKFYLFETYNPDLAAVETALEANPNTVWTLIDTNEGEEYISAGYHYVNRVGYFITEVPFEDGQEDILYYSVDELDD